MDISMIRELVSQMTLEEKAGLTSGRDNWFTKPVERLGIPSVRVSDGPHGLRTQEGSVSDVREDTCVRAVCFPSACATGASFDRELLYKMGKALGRECQALGVNVLLGPGVNMKRSPLCGRNFEYFSEDPVLAGELGAAFVNGVQSEGAGTSLKHFFANNQEHRRMDSSSELDERTMREIYLPAFERVVKKAQPWTVMASYNKVNGVYSTENTTAITDILRGEWGYQGLVVSDWGATHNRAGAVEAGCDLTMPSATDTDEQIIAAVREGRLEESKLDACCERLLALAFKAADGKQNDIPFDYEGDHALAAEIAAESMVLLKNNGILPLDKGAKVAFIGPFADAPRYQGGGSSHINSCKVVSAVAAARAQGLNVTCAAGCRVDGSVDDTLLDEAIKAAKEAEVAVLFVGLTDAMESEGVDRRHLHLPDGHNALVGAVCAANPNTAVVLHNGSPVELPWEERASAILESYLGGQAVGEAVVQILFGDVNPSGHLAESFPLRLEDNPSYLTYFGEGTSVPYAERLFVGYRYYESKKMPVRYSFGHGLSYTTFSYTDLKLDHTEIHEEDPVCASVTVTNTGERAGKAVVQLYIAPEKQEMIRPVRELKDFTKVLLQPGESKRVTFQLDRRCFAHWNATVHDWCVEDGHYTIQIGYNAHDIAAEAVLRVHADPLVPEDGYSLDTAMAELAKTAKGYQFLDQNIDYFMRGIASIGILPKEICDMLLAYPVKIDMAAIERFGEMAGSSATGVSGMKTMLTQPISTIYGFLPDDKKQNLHMLLDELNRKVR